MEGEETKKGRRRAEGGKEERRLTAVGVNVKLRRGQRQKVLESERRMEGEKGVEGKEPMELERKKDRKRRGLEGKEREK